MKFLILCFVISFSTFTLANEDLEFTRNTLATLKSHGDNSNKERKIDFFFDFDSKKRASEAAAHLEKKALSQRLAKLMANLH